MKYFKIITILFWFHQGFSQNTDIPNTINPNRIPVVGLPTLMLTSSAVNGALGNAGVSTDVDITNWTLNVSKSAFQTEKNGISLGYMPHESQLIPGMGLITLSGYRRISEDKQKTEVFTYSLMKYSYGTAELRDNQGNSTGSLTGSDVNVKLGFAKKLSAKASAGISLNYFSSNIFDFNSSVQQPGLSRANGISGDIGYFRNGFQISDNSYWNHGISITNIGGKINYGDEKKWSYAPMQFKMGSTYNHIFENDGKDNNSKLSLSAEISKDLVPTPQGKIENAKSNGNSLSYIFTSWSDAPDGIKEEIKEIRLHLGAEYLLRQKIALRMGYQHESKMKGDRRYLSLGLGLRNINLDNTKLHIDGSYSLRMGDAIGIPPTYRLNLSMNFGGKQAVGQ